MLKIEGEELSYKSIGQAVTFIPIDNSGDPKFTCLEGDIYAFNEYYVFVNVSGELKTFFPNNLKWGHLKNKLV